jgi:metallo-beta-lactamase class B
MKQLTGAQVVALGADAAALEAGPNFPPVEVDRVIQDGDIVTLGGMTLSALWVPGHTQGATMWLTTVQEGGNTYSVLTRGGEIPNEGVPLFNNPNYPMIVEDTLWTLYRLKRRPSPDLVLHNHPQNLGRPLNPTLPVNASCTFCLDAEAWTDLVERVDATFKERLGAAGGQAAQ